MGGLCEIYERWGETMSGKMFELRKKLQSEYEDVCAEREKTFAMMCDARAAHRTAQKKLDRRIAEINKLEKTLVSFVPDPAARREELEAELAELRKVARRYRKRAIRIYKQADAISKSDPEHGALKLEGHDWHDKWMVADNEMGRMKDELKLLKQQDPSDPRRVKLQKLRDGLLLLEDEERQARLAYEKAEEELATVQEKQTAVKAQLLKAKR